MVDLDWFNESCNTFNYLGLLCVANKTEDVYLNVFGHDKKNKLIKNISKLYFIKL